MSKNRNGYYIKIFNNNKPEEGESVNDYLKRISKKEKINYHTIQKAYYRVKNKISNPVQPQVKQKAHISKKYDFDRKERVLKAQISELKKLYKKSLEDIEESEKRFDTLLNIKSHKVNKTCFKFKSNDEKHNHIPILVLSDWHVEERVDPKTVNNANEFNIDICQNRIDNVFRRSVRVIKHQSNFANIDSIYVLLNGDMISGYIHDELMESNYLSPTEAIRFCKKNIIKGLRYIVKELNLSKVIVQCNFGNHGRTTKKKKHSTSYKNSYEWLMYHDISDYFFEDDIFDFHVSNSLISYYTFKHNDKEFVLRTWHGDNIRFAGGVGGITIPLNKLIFRLDQQRKADYNIIGHFHTLFEANKRCLVNGSLIGYNAYAHNLGLDYEKPKQGLLMLDLNTMEIRSKYSINCD